MAKETIIVLDDDDELRNYFSTSLEAQGYRVISRGNSKNILELVELHQPALIISDIVMPDHEGMEGIFSIVANHDIPIIAVSAYKNYLDMVEDICARVLLKPIDIDKLIVTVTEVLVSPKKRQ